MHALPHVPSHSTSTMAYGTGWREGHPQGSGPSPAAIGTAVLGFLASFALGIVIGRGRSADQLFAPTAVRIAPQTAPAHLHGPVATGSVVPVTPPMPHYSRGRVPHADSAQAPGHARGGAPGSWGAAAVAAVMAPVAAVAAAAALVVAWRQRRAPLQTIEAPSALAMAASTGESRRSGGAGAADPSVRYAMQRRCTCRGFDGVRAGGCRPTARRRQGPSSKRAL